MSITNRKIDEAIVDLASVDYVDLWAIARVLDAEFGDALAADPVDVALDAVERLLRHGKLRAGDLVPPGEFEPWEEGVDGSIDVVRKRASGLGRMPQAGEVGWFELVD